MATPITTPVGTEPCDRAAINRANAARSTGPKSSAGKAASRENAWRHGMRSERAVMPGEDPAEFEALRADLRASYQPVGHHEEALVERIAIAEWKRRRFDEAEADIMWSLMSSAEYATTGKPPEQVRPERVTRVVLWASRLGLEHALELLCRYRSTVDRDWNRALSQLERLQRRRERMSREAAEAEATMRVHHGTNGGLNVRALSRVLHIARRDSILEGLGFRPAGCLSGSQHGQRGVDSPSRPNAWPSPGRVASFGQVGNNGSGALDRSPKNGSRRVRAH